MNDILSLISNVDETDIKNNFINYLNTTILKMIRRQFRFTISISNNGVTYHSPKRQL